MKNALLLVSICLVSGVAWGQNAPLSGQVLDPAGRPVIGATVVEKGTNNGTSTGGDGRFSLRPRTAAPRLIISSLGYSTKEIETTGGGALSISLAESSTSLDAVQVVGSRAQNRSVTDSPSPVDIIDIREVTTKTGQLDVNQLLQFVAPSFNSNRQTGSDGADHVDPASLRGLGPDQTLVLVNGKRQHQSALVNLFGSRGRGNTGTDLNVIPTAAIERIEILRDGAAAQYGSDAIAGVINIVLKTSMNELTANANYGAYTAKYRRDDQDFDGGNLNANLNYGLGLGARGSYVNATLDYNSRQHTQRANVPTGPDGLVRREYGDPKIANASAYLNSKFALSDKAHLYVFGGASKRKGDAYAWTRFADDERNVPAIYPNGFDPIITSDIVDASAVAGVRVGLGGFELDVSNNFGSNRFEYGLRNTLNASLGASSPTRFNAGGFQLQQDVVSLGLTRNLKTVLQGLNLAAGVEGRREWYSLFAGEEASYRNYDPANSVGGSQGFPGYQPGDAIKAQRDNVGAYLDAELSLTQQWLLAGALRYEHYSDFGSTLNYKASTRYNLTEFLTLRGTFSTGFRAPSLAQINFNSTFTNFVNGQPVEVLLARNDNPVTQKLGIPKLKEETSTSANVGFTSRLGSSLSFTVDGYYIKVNDRVVLTTAFNARNTDPDTGEDVLDPVIGQDLENLGVGRAQFFANATDTRSLGLDVVLNHTLPLSTGRLNTTLAANFNNLRIDRVRTAGVLAGREDDFFGTREQGFVKASAPASKVNLSFDYQAGRFGALLRLVRFDKVTLYDFSDVPQPMVYKARVTTDLTVNYALTNQLQLVVGSSNLFNRYPTLFDPQNTETGGAWDPVQMGSNGRFLFAKLQLRVSR
ncbi:TonB-dependent receptor domain-containing protein [uncultured Hymenobacter sp.]|uniref:TonB-dependent receptor n=1 Tax=uncultured Hymenobacter sp. TaxID=170016 RepID=UPI0035CC137D